MDIIDKINIYIDEDRMSGKTHAAKKSYERKHYRMTKHKKKSSLNRLERSAEGDKREKRRDKLAKAGRTPTGKDKVRYHV